MGWFTSWWYGTPEIHDDASSYQSRRSSTRSTSRAGSSSSTRSTSSLLGKIVGSRTPSIGSDKTFLSFPPSTRSTSLAGSSSSTRSTSRLGKMVGSVTGSRAPSIGSDSFLSFPPSTRSTSSLLGKIVGSRAPSIASDKTFHSVPSRLDKAQSTSSITSIASNDGTLEAPGVLSLPMPLPKSTELKVKSIFENVLTKMENARRNLTWALGTTKNGLGQGIMKHYVGQVERAIGDISLQYRAWIDAMDDATPRIAVLPNAPVRPLSDGKTANGLQYDIPAKAAVMKYASANIQRMMNVIGHHYMAVKREVRT